MSSTNETPNTLDNLPRKDRLKLHKLLMERDVLGYCFSYMKLFDLFRQLMDDQGETPDDHEIHAALQDCILAFDTPAEEQAKGHLDDQITALLAEHGMTGVRHQDPFGRRMVLSTYTSRSGGRFNRDKGAEIAPRFGVSAAKFLDIISAATEPGKEFTAVKVQALKETEE